MLRSKKGGVVIHIGAPLIIVLLIIFYLILTVYSPSKANAMTDGLRNLTGVVKNMMP
jgi:hypothetical protein